MKIGKIIMSLLSIACVGTLCTIPVHAESIDRLEGQQLLPFVISADGGYYAPFPVGVKQNVCVYMKHYPTYKKVTKINSFSYFDHSSLNYGITGDVTINNYAISMSNISETPLIYDGNVLVSSNWTWDNKYVIPGRGSTYSLSNDMRIEADGFVWMPNAINPYLDYKVVGRVS